MSATNAVPIMCQAGSFLLQFLQCYLRGLEVTDAWAGMPAGND